MITPSTNSRTLLSVGLDVGTTTTQVVFSRLTLANVARSGQAPRVGISAAEVLYQSPLAFTPLLDADTIDAARLLALVQAEYVRAGVEPAQVETGAVIITGETAKTRNAEQILQALGGLAGEFVVTVAGPYLESLIAGRGAGAAAYAQKNFCAVTNVDIGGGSANSATFRANAVVAAAAMNYGGRIIIIEQASGRIRHLAEPARHVLAHLGISLAVGDAPDLTQLRRFCDCLADLTIELIEGGQSSLAQRLYLTPPAAASGRGSVLMFSGGIGHYFYNPIPTDSVSAVTVHDDIGPLLAEALRRHPGLQAYQTARPAATLRATVLGASTQTVALSGSTIWAEREILPLRNVPVVRPQLPAAHLTPEAITQAAAAALLRWDIAAGDNFALAFDLPPALDYTLLLQLAIGLAEFARRLPADKPLVIVIGRDYAQALGQTIKGQAPQRPLLVIDQVGLDEGDYIDIGLPLMEGRVVPLSVKTLVFNH